jgi:hypothetical protein
LDLKLIENAHAADLKPMQATGWGPHRFGQSLVFHDNNQNEPTTFSEIMDNGSVFAAVDLHPSYSDEKQTSGSIHFQYDETQLVLALCRYIKFMRKNGVTGKLAVGVSLLNVEHAILRPHFRPSRHPSRPLGTNPYRMSIVMLPETENGEDIQSIAGAMKTVLNRLWRDAGLSEDPSFTPDGFVAVT